MLEQMKAMTFATVVSDKKLKYVGMRKGDEVLIMSAKDVAFKKGDPYLKRTLFIVAKVVDGSPQIPSDRNEYKSYVVDPRSLESVSEQRSKELFELLNEEYGRE